MAIDLAGVRATLDIDDADLAERTRRALDLVGVRVDTGLPRDPSAIIFRKAGHVPADYTIEAPLVYVWRDGRAPAADGANNPFEDLMGRHWLGASPDLDLDVLRTTLAFAHARRVPTFAELLGPDAAVETTSENASSQKAAHQDHLIAFCARHGLREVLHAPLVAAFEELFSNAIYDAPVCQEGKHTSLFTHRSTAVTSPRPVAITFGVSATSVGIAIRDAYGSLPVVRVIEGLARGYRAGGAIFETKEGGAGLGLSMLLRGATRMVITIDHGRACEIAFLRQRDERSVKFARSCPTLNVFTVG